MGKVNVDFGKGIRNIFDFINNISIVRANFINKLTPIGTNDFLYHTRHTRQSLVQENIDTFIFADGFFVISSIALLLKIACLILEKTKRFPKANKYVAWAFYVMFNLMYFDIQIIIFTELTQSRIISKKDDKFQLKILGSYMASLFFAFIMVHEIWKANRILAEKRKKFLNSNENLELKNLILRAHSHSKVREKVVNELEYGLNHSEILVIDKFTEDFSPYYVLLFPEIPAQKFQIINFSRILLMQVLIVSLQMLENVQILSILALQLAFIVYIFRILFKKLDLRT